MKSRTRILAEHVSQSARRPSRKLKYLAVCYLVTLMLFGTAMVSAFSNNPFTNSAFAGGWEATGSMESLTIVGTAFERPGLHTFTGDPDGNFVAAPDVYPPAFDKPGITLETSYPFYIRQVSGQWVLSEEAYLLDTYNVTLRNDANETRVQQYFHWTIGLDVTIKTDASDYYKTQTNPMYADYGYWFEDDVVDITSLVNFAVTPWSPAGSSGNWSIVGGWNGIMSASIVNFESGLISEDATENYGHTIQNLHSVGAALNMFRDESSDSLSPVGFSDQTGLAGIPQAIEVELSARLGAGCQYQTDYIGHVYDIAVRNVFVEYRIRIDVLSTLVWSLQLGHQGELQKPEENNTSYDPEITPWAAMFEQWRQLFYSPQFSLLLVAISISGVVILLVYLKRR